MKKRVFIVLMTMILVIVMLGCQKRLSSENDKTFSCHIKASKEGNSVHSYLFTFYYDEQGKNLKKYSQKLSFDYYPTSETLDTDKERDYNSAIKTCNEMKVLDGVNCSVNKNEKTNNLTFEMEVTLSEVDEKSKLGESMKSLQKASYNDVKESFLNSEPPWKCEER